MNSIAHQSAVHQVELNNAALAHVGQLLSIFDDVCFDDYGCSYYRPRIEALQAAMSPMIDGIHDRFYSDLHPALVSLGRSPGVDLDDSETRISHLRMAERMLANLAKQRDLEDIEFSDCMEGCRMALLRAVNDVEEAMAAIDGVLSAVMAEVSVPALPRRGKPKPNAKSQSQVSQVGVEA